MKAFFVIFISFLSWSAFSASRDDILNVFEKYRENIAQEIRLSRPMYKNKSTEEIFSSRNCEPASKALSKYLRKEGITVEPLKTSKHYYLKHKKLIIDPTFRQFYGVALIQIAKKKGEESYVFSEIDFMGMPEILIVEESKLKKTLESFPLKPEWLVKVGEEDYSFFPSEFGDWYLPSLDLK
jgi:hypothetical protein